MFFYHALNRLAKEFLLYIWLEAGSNSTVTNMASQALKESSNCHFQSVNITSESGLQNLVDTTINLWKEGLRVSFWAHHKSQTYECAPLLLPPYQFERTRHWLEFKKPQKPVSEPIPQPQVQKEELPKDLDPFVG